MTDLEIARIVRQGRRQGIAQACGIAFAACGVAAPVAAVLSDPWMALLVIPAAVLAALGVASVVANRDPS